MGGAIWMRVVYVDDRDSCLEGSCKWQFMKLSMSRPKFFLQRLILLAGNL